MTDDPNDRVPSRGWRWNDDMLNYRIKFVAGMAVVAAVASVGYIVSFRH